jgi:hypothetical protein
MPIGRHPHFAIYFAFGEVGVLVWQSVLQALAAGTVWA